MPKETISQTCTSDGRKLKMSADHLERIQADVVGPKRFYTQQWLDDYLNRFTVVETCAVCREPLIAEEVESHAFKHVKPGLRPILRQFMDLSEDDQAAVREFVAASSARKE